MTCPAALNIRGKHFPCDWLVDENGSHTGWAHSNKDAQAIWCGDEGPSDRAGREPMTKAAETIAKAVADARANRVYTQSLGTSDEELAWHLDQVTYYDTNGEESAMIDALVALTDYLLVRLYEPPTTAAERPT